MLGTYIFFSFPQCSEKFTTLQFVQGFGVQTIFQRFPYPLVSVVIDIRVHGFF